MNTVGPEIEYHVWHTPDGEVRGVGRIAPGAPANLHAVPLEPGHPGLRVTTVRMPEVTDPTFFDGVLLREGRFVARGESH
ncbi:hypothetical protein O7606_23560 [Micromonospora sp. WMMD882]|uniref:hypothetical protein n=1 Tax=Micromonospora sp. WMMD882 TaxID=3015151 RepID=UPI00248AF408|nr:hypothetical protein [Micromonospora sp. WMMD882]WBB79126.1 hypothetical protein O7606_23560 [Micromonospora sp. WMMD882]